MELQRWKMEVQEHVTGLKEELLILTNQITNDQNLYAFFSSSVTSPISGSHARTKAIEMLQQLDYSPSLQGITPVRRFAAIMGSPKTLNQVQRVNSAKQLFKSVHERIRRTIEGEATATEVMRSILKSSGFATLDLDACDRKIPCLDGAVQRLRWYYSSVAASTRENLADAIVELVKLKEQADEKRLPLIESEIAALQSMDPKTPVAHRKKNPVTSLKFRARVVNTETEKGTISYNDYGVNPIFFANTPRITPDIDTPKVRRQPGAGRPRIISDKTVSFSLPSWFWYKQVEARTKKSTRKPENPLAKTPFPGLWLGTRKRKNGLTAFVMVAVPNEVTTSFSIKKYGLNEAWEKAASIYSVHHEIALSELLAHTPNQAQVDAMLTWQNTQIV